MKAYNSLLDRGNNMEMLEYSTMRRAIEFFCVSSFLSISFRVCFPKIIHPCNQIQTESKLKKLSQSNRMRNASISRRS